jgi:hypothetical protein
MFGSTITLLAFYHPGRFTHQNHYLMQVTYDNDDDVECQPGDIPYLSYSCHCRRISRYLLSWRSTGLFQLLKRVPLQCPPRYKPRSNQGKTTKKQYGTVLDM